MDYMLRDIDTDWWKRVRARALTDGWPDVKTLVFALVGGWLKGQIKLTPPKGGKA